MVGRGVGGGACCGGGVGGRVWTVEGVVGGCAMVEDGRVVGGFVAGGKRYGGWS